MVRRRIAAGIAVVLLIVVVLLIDGCVKSQKISSLKEYNREVAAIAHESDTAVSEPLFSALTDSASKSALEVDGQINQLRLKAQELASRTHGLSVPGEMEGAQRAFLMAMNLREEGMNKLDQHVSQALGGQAKQASALIAGDMEIFLASDVLFSQRVVPLIEQTLSSNSIHGQTTPTGRFVPNIGWLESSTVFSRVTGQTASTSTNGVQPGNHGSGLVGVSVGALALQPEPALNHIASGANPTFTAIVENTGEFKETDVKVDVTVTAGGKQYKASHVINQTTPGAKVNVEIPVTGVPLGVASKVEVFVEGVPGENDLENNKGKFITVFSE